jgi:hypothetical protein
VRLAIALAVIVLGLFGHTSASFAGTVKLAWNRNPESGATYIVGYGTQSGNPTSKIDVGSATTATIDDLVEGQRYYFVVYARIQSAMSSASSEVTAIAKADTGGQSGRRSPSDAAEPGRGSALPRSLGVASSSATATPFSTAVTPAAQPSTRRLSSAAAECPVSLSNDTVNVESGSFTVTVVVAAAFDCAWSAASAAPWLTIMNGTEGVGSGSLEILVGKKQAAGSRSGRVKVGPASLTIAQAGGPEAAPFAAGVWDIDHDGRGDMVVWRPETGDWYVRLSDNPGAPPFVRNWGVHGDVPVIGDYDGDGVGDFAVWRPSTGTWYVLLSTTQYTQSISIVLGTTDDIPVPGDYDGDGRTDAAVWSPVNGAWAIRLSSTAYTRTVSHQWGSPDDRPVVGDFDGDGKADLGVWQPSTGWWSVRLSHVNYAPVHTLTRRWGLDNQADVPVVSDFDGDGVSDIAVWKKSWGTWHLLSSQADFAEASARTISLGLPGIDDRPVAADYDGDGRADVAMWQAATGLWRLRESGTGRELASIFFIEAHAGDQPVTIR